MARNGMALHAAWLQCSKLEGGATSWHNAQRIWKAEQRGPAQPAPAPAPQTPAVRAARKAPAAKAAAPAGPSRPTARTGMIVEPRQRATSGQVKKALDLDLAFTTEWQSVHKEATRAYADAAEGGKLRQPGSTTTGRLPRGRSAFVLCGCASECLAVTSPRRVSVLRCLCATAFASMDAAERRVCRRTGLWARVTQTRKGPPNLLGRE